MKKKMCFKGEGDTKISIEGERLLLEEGAQKHFTGRGLLRSGGCVFRRGFETSKQTLSNLYQP